MEKSRRKKRGRAADGGVGAAHEDTGVKGGSSGKGGKSSKAPFWQDVRPHTPIARSSCQCRPLHTRDRWGASLMCSALHVPRAPWGLQGAEARSAWAAGVTRRSCCRAVKRAARSSSSCPTRM
eukprot:280401-Prymnesium_polylepis.1